MHVKKTPKENGQRKCMTVGFFLIRPCVFWVTGAKSAPTVFTISPDLVFGVNASLEGIIEKCAQFGRKMALTWIWREHGFYAPKRFTISPA